MTTYRHGLEQLRYRKGSLSLWLALMALLISIAALMTLNHNGPFTTLKALYLAIDAFVLCLALIIRSIRASIISIVMLLVVLTM